MKLLKAVEHRDTIGMALIMTIDLVVFWLD
jgi:hypothetical protein